MLRLWGRRRKLARTLRTGYRRTGTTYLGSIGLGNITPILGTPPNTHTSGTYGRMAAGAAGKDSTTGHWEITGVVLQKPLPTYPHGFPPNLWRNLRKLLDARLLVTRSHQAPKSLKNLARSTCALAPDPLYLRR